jgi:hypothetical protein
MNAKGYKSLKEASLTPVSSNKSLEVSKKFEKNYILGMEMVKSFIKNTQKEIQDNTFEPRKCTGARGLGIFSLLPLFGCRFKSIQINGQAL